MRLSVHSGRLRALLVSGCAIAVLAAAPAAHASSVSEANGTLNITAAIGEANNVSIAQWGFGLKITDTGTKSGFPVGLTVGVGCWRLSSNSATCARPTQGASVNLGDGDDVVDLRDGVTDSLVCGPGNDGGNAETDDSVAADCEAVAKPVIPVDPPVTTDPPVDTPVTVDPPVVTPPPANSVPPSIPAQTVGISASGVATVRVACPVGSGGCNGVVTIALPGAATARHAKAAAAPHNTALTALTIGSAKFKLAAGKSKSVPVRLSKRGRQRILRGRKRRRAKITVTTHAADGTTLVVTQNVTLRAPAKPKKRHKGHK
jgi:hypothetical protein